MRLWICWTILSLGSLFGITQQSLVMPSSDPWDRTVYPIHKFMIDSYMLMEVKRAKITTWGKCMYIFLYVSMFFLSLCVL